MSIRKIAIAQVLIAEGRAVRFINEDDDGYHYKANGLAVRVKPGGTVAIKEGEDWKTLDVGVPQDIVDLQDISMDDFHTSLSGWMADSRKFKEET